VKLKIISLVALVVLVLAAYTQLTIFVIQPLGAVPEGRTVVIWRRTKTKFIDSADAVCLREMGGVNLFCRVAVLGGIVGEDGKGIPLRLPYSRTLYLVSTGGKEFDR
jgi:hypothetical protein